MSQPLRPPSTFRRQLLGCLLALFCVCGAHGQEPHRRARRFLHGRASSAKALVEAKSQHLAMATQPRAASLSAAWISVGPAQVATASYGAVTGRITSIVLDPADATGNTVYLGTTGGGVWRSTNAAGPAASVVFAPLTDTLPVFNASAGATAIPSLSIGALAMANGVLLAGTGDPNDATDSYYGEGVLRSIDGGATWTLTQGSRDGAAGNHSFVGLSFAGFAFSSATPSLVVAAVSQAAEGDLVNAADLANSVKGLYFSTDAGVTWQMATVLDGAQVVQQPLLSGQNAGGNAATAVVWNPVRQRFYAALRYHGYYESTDGRTWTRLAHQPGAGLTLAACPTATSTGCPLFRGALAVQPLSGDTFALSVDGTNRDQGLWRDVCAASGTSCATSPVQFASQLPGTALEQGGGSTVIAQADYNLALAAVPSGADTLLFTGTIDLYRCSLAAGCVQRNTTNALNGCAAPAKVAPAQHAVAALSSGLLYIGNDGGLWRSNDGVNQLAAPCSTDDATHFQNLNGGLGSLAEVTAFAQHPTDPTILLAGLGANGTAASTATPWPQLAVGEGGAVAIDPANPSLWYLSTAAGVSIGRCAKGTACTAADFTGTPAIAAAQTANDISAIDAPWLLDPSLSTSVLVGTCRMWRGAATGSGWSTLDLLSRPYGAPAATACSGTSPVMRSLAAGGPVSGATAIQNAGSQVLYAGLAGTLDGGGALGGHLFGTTSAGTAGSTTVWTDLAKSSVTNDLANSGVFNPGGFDLSSVAVDAHDPTGQTVYATVQGFAGNGVGAPRLYRSTDGGAHWTNISSNLPVAPANAVLVDPNDANTLYVALDTGLYVTSAVTTCTTANCWSVYGTGLPNAPVVGLAAASAMPTGDGRTGELRAATYGRGIWQIPLVTAISPTAPAMTLAPATLTLGTQAVGTVSTAQAITVTNTGNASLTVSSVVPTGDFTQTNTCTAAAVAPGASCTVQVSFLPTATGARSGVLTVYGNVTGGQATASLNGTGAPPAAIVLNPIVLPFPGTTTVGATSATLNITISNTGGVASGIASIAAAGDFRISANTCGATLPAGTGCTVSLVFAPTASGSRSGTLTVVDDAGTQTASLTGTGSSPATDALSPLALSFPAQVLNTASAAQQVTLTNSGDVALTLIATQIASGDFTAVNGCGNSLNPHSSCVIAVSFVPKSVGAQTGALTVSDQFRSQTVMLNGVGVAPAGVSLSPVSGIAFAATPVGLSSAAQTVTLTNNGGVALGIAGVAVAGDFTVSGSTCGASLAAGTACTLQVAFAPAAAGPRTGSLTFTDSAANSPQSLALSGIGVDFTLGPNGPTTATLVSGATASYGLLLSSAAGVPGTVGFTCTGVPAHAACAVSPTAPSLGGTTVVTVSVGTGLAKMDLPLSPWTRRTTWLAVLMPLAFFRRARRGIAGVCLLLVLAGCGATRTIPAPNLPSGSTPTPSGTYNLLVSGSSGGVTKTVGLTLIVQ